MGNICARPEDKEPTIERQNSQPYKINSTIHDSEVEKISEIKEFLTLTAQNTTVFGERKQDRSKTITDFKVVRGLGRGAFGQVFMVRDVSEGRLYAMKIILKNSITCSEEVINTLSERFILEAMDHPFIVKLHYAFQSESKLYLLCDLMPGGELFYLLRRSRKFPEEVAKFYAAEILLALEYLHSRNIIYRDLKPENILLDQDGHIKITDFGLSKVCHSGNQMTFSICGTPEYIAPEVMLRKGYNQSADWFSFGSLLYDMLTGKPPFYSANKQEILKAITTKTVPLPDNISMQAKSLLKGLFRIKPKERLGYARDAQEIKEHPFFANVNFEQLQRREVDAPISFQEALNCEGFDMDFQPSMDSTVNVEPIKPEGGLVFDGFTYQKPGLKKESHKQQEQEEEKEEEKEVVEYYSPS